MIRASEIFVCSPTDYGKMSTFVGVECEDVNNRWIYQIIDKQWDTLDEQVCLDKEDWVMVKNKQHNQDLLVTWLFSKTKPSKQFESCDASMCLCYKTFTHT